MRFERFLNGALTEASITVRLCTACAITTRDRKIFSNHFFNRGCPQSMINSNTHDLSVFIRY